MKNVVLSIDPATETGWCLAFSSNPKEWKYGTWIINRNKQETIVGARLCRFEKLLMSMILSKGVNKIVYEIPVIQHTGATIMHAKLVSIIEMVAYKNGIDVFPCNPSQVKKFLTDKGNANKELVMEAVKNIGYEGENHNESDAFAMLYHHFNS